MENDVLDALQDIGYSGPILEDGGLEKALEGSYKSSEFRHVVVWLAAELRVLCKLDEQINDVSSSDEASSFLLELSSFLKEIGCQYKMLTEGHVTERLNNKTNAALLLHYLVTELEAARMVAVKKPATTPFMEIKLQETSTASELKSMLIALKFPKPPDNIQPSQLFEKVEQRLKDVVAKVPPELLSKPLFAGAFTDKQWHLLADLQHDLHEEYRMRREMLIKRLDVTIQSFQWSDRVKNKSNEVGAAIVSKRRNMTSEPSVRLSDLLAAREDLAIMEKTSNASVRKNTQTKLTKIIIGQVPDRGGRTTDQAAPPPEMPSWQKDRNSGGGFSGGRGGGGRGGGRGGRGGGGDRNRVQGGWNQGSNDRGQGGHDRDRDRGQGGWNQGGHDRDRGQGGWNQGGHDRDRDRNRGQGWNRGRDDDRGDRRGGGGYNREQGGQYGGDNHHGNKNSGHGGGGRRDNYR